VREEGVSPNSIKIHANTNGTLYSISAAFPTFAKGRYNKFSFLSGSAANFLHGAIDYKVGALMIVIQILGILLGVYMANRMDTTKLRKMVAWVCLFCGGFILVNAIRGIVAM